MHRIFFDVETTGLKPEEGARVIEIGAVACVDNRIISGEGARFHTLVDPQRSVSAGSYEIHGIGDDDLRGAPLFADIAEQFADFVRGKEVYAHNSPFDVSFLDMEYKRLGAEPFSEIVGSVTDTLMIARNMFPGRSNSLDSIARRMNINVEERRPRHNAMIDAEILAEVYAWMMSGQSDLDLESSMVVRRSGSADGREIEIVRLPPDPEAARRHREYLEKMHRDSGVEPLLLRSADPDGK